MSAVIFEANCVDSLVSRLTKEKTFNNIGKIIIGFLVGHHLTDIDYVVHLIRCSDKFGPLFDTVEAAELKEVEIDPKTPNRPLDEESVLLHGRQILRMLPGGSDIVGLFAFGQKKDLLENQALIMRLARRTVQLRNEMSNFDEFQPTMTSKNGSNRFLLMNRDSSSTKITVTTLESNLSSSSSTSNVGPSLSTVSTSSPFLERRIQYFTVGCSLNLDLRSYSTVVFRANGSTSSSSTAQSHDFESQCHNVLRPFFERLRAACITFDGALHDDFEVLDAAAPVQAGILLPEERLPCDSPVKRQSCLSKMHLKGNLVCRIQLPSKCTFGEASTAIKQDLARGLRARIQLHAEGANVVEGEELAVEAFHRLPRRVFLSLLEKQQTPSQNNRRTSSKSKSSSASASTYSSPLLACDYLFEAETVDDAAKNFADVFDLDLQSQDLTALSEKVADQLELVPDECKLLAGDAFDFSFRDQGPDKHRTSSLTGGVSSSSMESVEQLIEMENKILQSSNRWTLVYVCLAILIALIACLFYLLLYSRR